MFGTPGTVDTVQPYPAFDEGTTGCENVRIVGYYCNGIVVEDDRER